MSGMALSTLAGAMLFAAGTALAAGDPAAEVRAAEAAFARSMAERDHAAFVAHLADEAIFFSERGVLRGKAAVAAGERRSARLGHARPQQRPGVRSGRAALRDLQFDLAARRRRPLAHRFR